MISKKNKIKENQDLIYTDQISLGKSPSTSESQLGRDHSRFSLISPLLFFCFCYSYCDFQVFTIVNPHSFNFNVS